MTPADGERQSLGGKRKKKEKEKKKQPAERIVPKRQGSSAFAEARPKLVRSGLVRPEDARTRPSGRRMVEPDSDCREME